MNMFKAATTVCCITLLGATLAPPAAADAWDRKTVVTFSQPVETPGVHLPGWDVLPAGTYVFKILDSAASRHIVQILDENETTVYATILAIPNYRLKATDKTVITFSERPAGQPEALRGWFYPGRQWGEEFVYPKSKALELAKATNTPVLFTPAEMNLEYPQPIRTAQEPPVAELKRAPVRAITPSGEEVELAQAVTPPPPAEMAPAPAPAPRPVEMAQAAAPAPRPQTLPETAGALPLIALIGLLSLGGAFALRRFTRRRAL